MPFNDLEHEDLIKGLIDNFNVLADEVQLLSDRKTILEHKLRFAHEQYQRLADKYASGDSEISNTLAKLQLPPDVLVSSPDQAAFVPLPLRKQISPKLQTAVVIRDGRRVAQRLTELAGRSTGSTPRSTGISESRSNLSYSARQTSLSTVLEQDFTVPGKKGSLHCPFSQSSIETKPKMNTQGSQASGTLESDRPLTPPDMKDPTPHRSSDPICAALYAETMSSAPPSATGSAAKCPIRFLDQHSPEEVARYFETHKHEIPRSHEICVKRYQRNEEDIRKLDAKYGNLVSMIQGLGQKHQPMLPLKQEEDALEEDERDPKHAFDEAQNFSADVIIKEDEILGDAEHVSNERVRSWAQNVSADGIEHEEEHASEDDEDRESRFDRTLKEIRVGESPSRPWGISVPILDPPGEQRPHFSPPASVSTKNLSKTGNRSPFGHGAQTSPGVQPVATPVQERPVGKCPFGHGAENLSIPPTRRAPVVKSPFVQTQSRSEREITSNPPSPPVTQAQPAFINPSVGLRNNMPQMVFTGPVFIGYPMEQAITFMQQFKGM